MTLFFVLSGTPGYLTLTIDLLSKADLFNALFKHVISSHWQVLTRRALGKQVLDDIDIA